MENPKKIEVISSHTDVKKSDKREGIDIYGSKPLGDDQEKKEGNVSEYDNIRQKISSLEEAFKDSNYVGDKSLIEKQIIELENKLRLKTAKELAMEGNIAWDKGEIIEENKNKAGIEVNSNTSKTEPENTPAQTLDKGPIKNEVEKVPELVPSAPEKQIMPLEKSRDLYLKAKRLRGNVFRGRFGNLFKRTLHFGADKMDFGGESGRLELEAVRTEYEKGLTQYRTSELKKFEGELSAKLAKGEITEESMKAEMQTKIVNLLTEEQKNIDEKSTNGIEKNILEKMKTKWRQMWKQRLGVSGALLGAALLGVGGTSLVGARAVWGGIGTYTGVESGLERLSKSLGHKSELMTNLSKFRKGTKKFDATDESYKTFMAQIPPEEIKKEAARLRMLQVEKGVSIDKLAVSGDNGKMASIIIAMDNELTAKEVMDASKKENPNSVFADILSKKLALEVDSGNKAVESEVDKERIKKMKRKTIAVLAGATTGWLIGGKLLQHHDTPPVTPPPHTEVIPIPHHTVTSGENVWKIIEHDLDSHNTMAGLGSGARTYTIDALKDHLAAMPKADLIKLGFKSGNINIIHTGDTLDMSGILNTDNILHALSGAKNLTPDQISSIVKNNAKIASWYSEHHHELSKAGKVFDSSVIDKILHGINPIPGHNAIQHGSAIGDKVFNYHDTPGINGHDVNLGGVTGEGYDLGNGAGIQTLKEFGDNSGIGGDYTSTIDAAGHTENLNSFIHNLIHENFGIKEDIPKFSTILNTSPDKITDAFSGLDNTKDIVGSISKMAIEHPDQARLLSKILENEIIANPNPDAQTLKNTLDIILSSNK